MQIICFINVIGGCWGSKKCGREKDASANDVDSHGTNISLQYIRKKIINFLIFKFVDEMHCKQIVKHKQRWAFSKFNIFLQKMLISKIDWFVKI